MKVEPATPDDAAEIAALGRLLHDSSSYADIPYNEEKVVTLMRHLALGGDNAVFVVRRNGEIVGGIAGSVAPQWFSDELLGFEYSFFVEPGARNSGAAVKLLLAFKNWCAARGAKKVRIGITTGIQEELTGKFYRRMGFNDAGTLFQWETRDGN